MFLASRLHIRGLLESITRDLCHPDYHDNGGSQAEAHESPVLPPVFHRLATGGCYSGFSGGADENVKERRWHHPGPAREHVRPEFHTGQTIKVIAQIKWDNWTETEKKNYLGALRADCTVDPLKSVVSFCHRFDPVAGN